MPARRRSSQGPQPSCPRDAPVGFSCSRSLAADSHSGIGVRPPVRPAPAVPSASGGTPHSGDDFRRRVGARRRPSDARPTHGTSDPARPLPSSLPAVPSCPLVLYTKTRWTYSLREFGVQIRSLGPRSGVRRLVPTGSRVPTPPRTASEPPFGPSARWSTGWGRELASFLGGSRTTLPVASRSGASFTSMGREAPRRMDKFHFTI